MRRGARICLSTRTFRPGQWTVPIDRAPGRIAAEQVTPYPPGILVIVPGELIDVAVVDYLRSGLAAGMNVPDPADPSLGTLRVVAHTATIAGGP